MTGSNEILEFWLDELSPADWYKEDAALDAKIRQRFEATWTRVAQGALAQWLTYPSGALAYIILTDQFPRNMFRGEARAFSTDRAALAAAKCAIDKGWDLKIDEPARQFFYLPLMHSENLCDQERCVRLMLERMPETGAANLLHARAHREVIRQFGRFPYRNTALARATTAQEAEYVAAGSYGETVRSLQAAAG
ncbi:MAG TPA: DUF924 domain-containing protein [Rhodobacteraceae bacterium]|nr:DUF924 domain-containing protein [Paracoccaceae bacterium]